MAVSPPLAIATAPKTDVPVTAPPAISKMVVTFDFSLIPIPEERKNKIIGDEPNIIHAELHSLARSLVSLVLQLRQ